MIVPLLVFILAPGPPMPGVPLSGESSRGESPQCVLSRENHSSQPAGNRLPVPEEVANEPKGKEKPVPRVGAVHHDCPFGLQCRRCDLRVMVMGRAGRRD